MRAYKFLLPLVIIILILSTISLAESDITAASVKSLIKPNEKAIYKITINNTVSEKQRYSLYSLNSGLGWDVESSPIKDRVIEILPHSSYITTLIIKPLDAYPPGIYAIAFNVDSDLGERHSLPLKIYLLPEYTVAYNPSIKANIDMNEKIDPNFPLSIKLSLENKNPLNLSNLKIKIKSDMPEFNKEVTIDLPPLEKKTAEFTIIPSIYQQPKHYSLFFVFEHNGEEVKVVEQKVELLTQTPAFSIELKEKDVYLKQYYQAIVTNKGNVINTQELKIPITLWETVISKGQEDVIREKESYYLVWTASLAPKETIVFSYTINYWLYVYIVLALVLLIWFYFYVQPPLAVKKTAIVTKTGEEDAPAQIKITLEIRNKKKKTLKNLTVTDFVPGIAVIAHGDDLGTLKPQEIRNTASGAKIQWHIAELEGEEQRLITYKVKTKINVLGSFKLPRAKIEYKKKGLAKNAYSDPVTIGK